MVLDRKAGCEKFELPEDRVGDIIIISQQHKALGTSSDRHDLSGLKEPLRSHGGVTEQNVPLLMNCKSDIPADRKLRNFDIYDIALNHSI
jgi:phosphonoacetate hydrolase